MYQLFMVAMFLALLTNNMGLLWVAMEAATLSTVLLVSLYRTRASLEAAWKYFILCGVGIAQALVRHHSCCTSPQSKRSGPPRHDCIAVDSPQCSEGATRTPSPGPGVCLPTGGIWDKSRSCPLHNWLARCPCRRPDTGVRCTLRLALNVALYAVIRCKVLVEGSIGSYLPGRMLMTFGLLSAVLGAFFLWRQRDIKRLFGYSSIEHMGIITFAFGLGGPDCQLCCACCI